MIVTEATAGELGAIIVFNCYWDADALAEPSLQLPVVWLSTILNTACKKSRSLHKTIQILGWDNLSKLLFLIG